MSTQNDSNKIAPYVTFAAQLRLALEEQGIEEQVQVREISRFVCFESLVNGHKFYVPKSTGVAVGLCETTLHVQHLNGARPMPKDNGKIKSLFLPNLELIKEFILPMMVSEDDRLPENRKAASKKATTKPVGEMTREELQALIDAL